MLDDQLIFLSTQKKVDIDEPEQDDIYTIGTVVKINQMLKLPNGTIRVLVEGMYRAEINAYIDTEKDYYQVDIRKNTEIQGDDTKEEALMCALFGQFKQ